jgi:hypothetical protein
VVSTAQKIPGVPGKSAAHDALLVQLPHIVSGIWGWPQRVVPSVLWKQTQVGFWSQKMVSAMHESAPVAQVPCPVRQVPATQIWPRSQQVPAQRTRPLGQLHSPP